MPPTEAPQFWSQIANDSSYSNFQRRKAAIEILRRYVHVGMPISKLKQLLNHPTWVQASDNNKIDFIIGKNPVHFDIKDTVFVILILPIIRDSAVYLHISGTLEIQSFRSLILGTST